MRVLAINQFFWPDTAATGQLLADVTRGTDPNTHPITVICGGSKYAATDFASPPPVAIVRLGNVGFSRGRIGRTVSYLSFFAAAAFRSMKSPKPAVVLTLTTPPLISVVGTLLKKTRGSRHFIWEMDLYPDIAVDLNVFNPRSLTTRMIGAVADFSRKRADGIIVLGDDMKTRLIARGVPEHKIVVAENWADGHEISPAPFPKGSLVIHYSGTFGLAHEEHTITAAMRQLRNDARFKFVFAGGGARRGSLENLCRAEGIANAEFRPYAKRADLSLSLAEGHLGLVTQMTATAGSVVPSKVYGIMAAGRPVLYIGPKNATPARIVEEHGCGWRIEPGDTVGLVQLLRALERNREALRDAGGRARKVFEQKYDKQIGVARILSVLGVLERSATTEPAAHTAV